MINYLFIILAVVALIGAFVWCFDDRGLDVFIPIFFSAVFLILSNYVDMGTGVVTDYNHKRVWTDSKLGFTSISIDVIDEIYSGEENRVYEENGKYILILEDETIIDKIKEDLKLDVVDTEGLNRIL